MMEDHAAGVDLFICDGPGVWLYVREEGSGEEIGLRDEPTLKNPPYMLRTICKRTRQ